HYGYATVTYFSSSDSEAEALGKSIITAISHDETSNMPYNIQNSLGNITFRSPKEEQQIDANSICPICYSEILKQDGSGSQTWLNDPIKTPKGLAGQRFVGFQRIKKSNITAIQTLRVSQEANVGIAEDDQTVFSPIAMGYVRIKKSHIIELRTSTSAILDKTSKTLSEYFNQDENGNDMGSVQSNWHENDLSSWDGHIRAVHVEDLRHYIDVSALSIMTTYRISSTSYSIYNLSPTLDDVESNSPNNYSHYDVFPEPPNIGYIDNFLYVIDDTTPQVLKKLNNFDYSIKQTKELRGISSTLTNAFNNDTYVGSQVVTDDTNIFVFIRFLVQDETKWQTHLVKLDTNLQIIAENIVFEKPYEATFGATAFSGRRFSGVTVGDTYLYITDMEYHDLIIPRTLDYNVRRINKNTLIYDTSLLFTNIWSIATNLELPPDHPNRTQVVEGERITSLTIDDTYIYALGYRRYRVNPFSINETWKFEVYVYRVLISGFNLVERILITTTTMTVRSSSTSIY
ncbi:hypothetical protein LCGC14_2454870, partial [marine sediment metagenome]